MNLSGYTMTQIRKATNDDANAPAGGLNVVDIKNVLIANDLSALGNRAELVERMATIVPPLRVPSEVAPSEVEESSSDTEEICGNCGQEAAVVESCYGCKYDFCDNCGFNGGCGVCDAEEDAWEKFEEALQKIRTLNTNSVLYPNLRLPMFKTSLTKLISFMEYWQHQVQAAEDHIHCMAFMGGGLHDASDIMTDCGETVRDEMNWYLNKSEAIKRGESTFDMEIPLQ